MLCTLGRTLISVLRATTDVIDWSLLALLIGAAESEYNRIMRENQNDVAGQRNAIIKKWLDTGKATWAILVSGLKDKLVGLAAIGNQIAKDHPSKFLVNYIADDELIYIGLDGPVHASLIIDKIINL